MLAGDPHTWRCGLAFVFVERGCFEFILFQVISVRAFPIIKVGTPNEYLRKWLC